MADYITDGVVVRLSEFQVLQTLPPDICGEAALALLRQGFTGEQQTNCNPMIQMLLTLSFDNQVSSTDKYRSAVRGGASGGRPETISTQKVAELYRSGKGTKEIADELGCSIRTIQKKLCKLGFERMGERTRTNLNEHEFSERINANERTKPDIDIDTDSDTDYASDNDTDYDVDKDTDSALDKAIRSEGSDIVVSSHGKYPDMTKYSHSDGATVDLSDISEDDLPF